MLVVFSSKAWISLLVWMGFLEVFAVPTQTPGTDVPGLAMSRALGDAQAILLQFDMLYLLVSITTLVLLQYLVPHSRWL